MDAPQGSCRNNNYIAAACALAMSIESQALAQAVPTIDTEDATLGSSPALSSASVHPLFAMDLRNGDFARGAYDDDRADLDRLPVHAQVGLAVELKHRSDGTATGWLVLRSSNGLHAPGPGEATTPRSWYESNNLAAVVISPIDGLHAAAVYTIKTSPNGVSATTHEASLSFAYEGTDALGSLSPTIVATVRPKGNHGVYTQAGIEPAFALSPQEGSPKLSLPVAMGVDWGGFYGLPAGNRTFVSAGMAVEKPFSVGGTQWNARAEAVALIRDDRLAALSSPEGEVRSIVPLVTFSVSMAY